MCVLAALTSNETLLLIETAATTLGGRYGHLQTPNFYFLVLNVSVPIPVKGSCMIFKPGVVITGLGVSVKVSLGVIESRPWRILRGRFGRFFPAGFIRCVLYWLCYCF